MEKSEWNYVEFKTMVTFRYKQQSCIEQSSINSNSSILNLINFFIRMQMQGEKHASEVSFIPSLDLCESTDDYSKYVNRIVNNHDITTDTLYEIASIIKQPNEYGCNADPFGYNCTHKHNFHVRVLYANIIILELFNSEVEEVVIDKVYRQIGRRALKYNDDSYVDELIDDMEMFDINEKCLPLILIANALCGGSIFA